VRCIIELERKQDRSIYYWLKNLFNYPNFHIVDGYPEGELELPTIAIDFEDLRRRPHEIGNRVGESYIFWSIDIYAETKDQRDEIGFRIIKELENKIPVYDYDEGFPPLVSPTEIGVLDPEEIRLKIIKVIPDFVDKLFYRAQVMFITRYEQKT